MSLCSSCHAGCCRSFAVPVTGADILRLQRDLKLTFWDIVCRWADPQGTIARRYAPQFHFDDEPETPFVLCLLHDESTFFPGTPKCRFLNEGAPDEVHPLGQARCGVYHSRPAACRSFPTKMTAAGDLAVLYDVPASGKPGHEIFKLCPRPWEPEDVCPIDGPQDLVVARYEMAFFHQLAEAWNRRPGEWAAFPEFLHLVYSRRILPAPPRTDVAETQEASSEDQREQRQQPLRRVA